MKNKYTLRSQLAFTLSEILIALTILGIILAVTMPVLHRSIPDKDKYAYAKGMYNVQSAISSAMDSDVFFENERMFTYWNDNKLKDNTTIFCETIYRTLNTIGDFNCETSDYENQEPNFITADGIRYYGFDGAFSGRYERVVRVDRLLTDREISRRPQKEPGLKINVTYDGKVYTPPDVNGTYDYENRLIESAFNIRTK